MEDEDNGFDEDNEIDNDSMANNEYEHDRSDEAYEESRDRECESLFCQLQAIAENARNDQEVRNGLQQCDDLFVCAPRYSMYYHNNPQKMYEHIHSQAYYQLVDFKDNNRCVWLSIFDEASKHERLNQ